jgi:hypothetical protein
MEQHNENIKILIDNVKDKIGKPVSSRVVAATIESFGIRDIDTENDYGVASIQELSLYIYRQLTTVKEHKESLNAKEKEAFNRHPETISISDYLSVKTKIFVQYYPLGIFHLLPIILQIISIIIFGYSLWTHVNFNHVQSTAVVLGVIIGIISTGGFVQVIGRQASFFWNYQDYQMTRKTINYLLKMGIISLLIVIGILFLANTIFHLYSFKILIVTFIYALLIGTLLLVIAPLHTIYQRWMITVSVVIGTGFTIILNQFSSISIYFTHWIGILVAIGLARVYVIYFFNKKIKNGSESLSLRLKDSVFIYQNYQYFLYGIFIYVFIFTDRILAWSSNNASGKLPFIIYFEKDYELGMDLAMLVFLLLAGVLEFSIASFTRLMDLTQKLVSYKDAKLFNKELFKMYWQNMFWLFATSIVIFIFIYFIITASWGYKGQFKEELMSLSIRVCFIGGVGYMFLAWGMLNTLYLFTLGQPSIPLKAIIYACIVNITVGFIVSRFVSFEYSVIGMLVGALVFASITLKEMYNYFRNLDYYYYASY